MFCHKRVQKLQKKRRKINFFVNFVPFCGSFHLDSGNSDDVSRKSSGVKIKLNRLGDSYKQTEQRAEKFDFSQVFFSNR